ncbi:MAG: hypothetical protein AAB874_07980, partial [Patescibacteria group bacterium]
FFKRDMGIFAPVAAFAVGSLVLYTFTLMLYGLHLPIKIALIIYTLVITLMNVIVLPKINRAALYKQAKIVIAIVFLSSVVFSIWKFDNPYPYVLNWDIFEHQTLVNEMKQGKFSVLPSHVSDTFRFDGYTTLYYVLVGVPQILVEPEPLGFWWIVELLHLVTTVTASYVLAYAITKKQLVALISAVFGAFIFESYIAYASFFLVPQTLAAMLSVFAIAYLFHTWNKEKRVDAGVLIVWTVTILVVHLIVGAAAILLVGVIYLGKKTRLSEKSRYFIPVWLLLTAIAYVVLTFGVTKLPLTTINYGEAASYIHLLSTKIEYLRVFYGWSIFILVLLGAIITIVRNKGNERLVLLVMSLTLVVVASPLPYVFKFYVLGRYLVHIVMAIAVGWIFMKVTAPLLRVLMSSALLVTLAMVLVLNARYWKDFVRYGNQTTLISKYEIEAAEFVKNKYAGKKTLLVSDPATSYVLEAVSAVNSPGGAYMNQQNREKVNALFQVSNRDEFLTYLYAIKDTQQTNEPDAYIMIVSGRAYQWHKSEDAQKYNLSFNIFSPKALPLEAYQYGEKITEYGAKPIFANREVMLFEVRRDI